MSKIRDYSAEFLQELSDGRLIRYKTVIRGDWEKANNIRVENYKGKYGAGYKVYTHMINGSNIHRFARCYMTYYVRKEI